MKNKGSLNVTTDSHFVYFKCKIPMELLSEIGVSLNDKKININLSQKTIIIKKAITDTFNSLSTHQKCLQLKKYELINTSNFKLKKDLINSMCEYYNIKKRTAYNYLKMSVNIDEVNNTNLLDKQNDFNKNSTVIFSKVKGYIIPIINIPSEIATNFLIGKQTDKPILEIFPDNCSYPISIECKNNEIILNFLN